MVKKVVKKKLETNLKSEKRENKKEGVRRIKCPYVKWASVETCFLFNLEYCCLAPRATLA